MSRLLMKSAVFIGDATYRGKLYKIGTYPGVIPSKLPADLVRGEIYRLSNPRLLLPRLDKYEECSYGFSQPTKYIRKIQSVRLINNGKTLKAWVYLYNRRVNQQNLLRSGDFIMP